MFEATAKSAQTSLGTLAGKSKVDLESNRNSTRDVQRAFKRMGFTLPIEIKCLEHPVSEAKLVKTHHVLPESWIQYWMNEAPENLGGWSGDAYDNFEAFWRTYQVQHPEHKIYEQHSGRLRRVVPICLHGDEGRTIKRANYLVFAMESPLGSLKDESIKKCTCTADLKARFGDRGLPNHGEDLGILPPYIVERARKQLTNYKGHSFMSRFLLFSIGSWIYKKYPGIIEEVYSQITKSFERLFYQGICLSDGSVVFGALISLKGDMDYHKKSMNLIRSYANVGTKSHEQICHQCGAGGPGIKFEDYSESPCWTHTMFNSRPWDESDAPVLSQIPFDEQTPELMLQGDLFHVFKVGIARDLIGGILIILLRKGFMDYPGDSTALENRLKRAHTFFSLWCGAQQKSPSLRSFTKHFLNMKKMISAPWTSSKGSDSILLLQWLEFTVKLNISNPAKEGHQELLETMLQVIQAGLSLRMVHGHGLWLERNCASMLYVHMMTFLRGYSVLGQASLRLGIRAFIQKPKHHALHHLAFSLRRQLRLGATLVSNPQMNGCEVNEDFIGRISRLSRRVGIHKLDLRVFQRSMLKVGVLLKARRDRAAKGRVK